MIQIVATGLNHRTAPVALRERFALKDDDVPAALQMLLAQPGVQEAVIISTCNRVELYSVEETEGTGPQEHGTASFFSAFFNVEQAQYINHLYRFHDEKAVRHLFSVASSLDSMIVGEPQILGQVKEYFTRAQAEGATGRVLNGLFSRSLAVGKRTRTETSIGEMAVSVPYAAVELAKKVFDSLHGKSVTLLGRGKMSELTSRHLKRSGVESLYVVNRTHEKAVEFAKKVGGVPLVYDHDLDFLLHTDVMICSARAPHPLVTRDALQKVMVKRRNRLLLLIDISVPREIDPAINDMDNVYLFNIDHLENMIAENKSLRAEEARKAGAIIEEELVKFMEWWNSLDVVPTIRAFREHLDTLRSDELARVMGNYEGFTDEQKDLVEQFSRSLINKVGHLPTIRLRGTPDPEKARDYSSILKHLFDLEPKDKS